MSKVSEIIEGWKNYTFPNPHIEAIAKERITICCECDKLRKNNTCMLCGCYMPAKVRSSKSHCRLKRW